MNEQITDKHLKDWARRQRRAYRDGELTPDQISSLEALPGWRWNLGQNLRFERWVAEYRALKAGGEYSISCLQLQCWAEGMRNLYHRGVLPPANVTALEAIPGWTWS